MAPHKELVHKSAGHWQVGPERQYRGFDPWHPKRLPEHRQECFLSAEPAVVMRIAGCRPENIILRGHQTGPQSKDSA